MEKHLSKRDQRLKVIEATTVKAACTFKPSLPKKKKNPDDEDEEDDEDDEEDEENSDRRAVEAFMGRYQEDWDKRLETMPDRYISYDRLKVGGKQRMREGGEEGHCRSLFTHLLYYPYCYCTPTPTVLLALLLLLTLLFLLLLLPRSSSD